MCEFCLHVHSLFLWYQHQSEPITLIPKPEFFEHFGNPSLTFHHQFSKKNLRVKKSGGDYNRYTTPNSSCTFEKKAMENRSLQNLRNILHQASSPCPSTPRIRMDIKSLYHRCIWCWRQNSYIDQLGIWMSWSVSIPAKGNVESGGLCCGVTRVICLPNFWCSFLPPISNTLLHVVKLDHVL